MNYLLWGLLLVAQNAAFTLVSRARNSKSVFYHAWASVLSNGIWFASQFILVDAFVNILKTSDWVHAVTIGIFYTVCTMGGALGSHWLALHKIEKGKE